MHAPGRTKAYATRKAHSAHLVEILRRVAKRGGTRHVKGGSLILRVPRARTDLVS